MSLYIAIDGLLAEVEKLKLEIQGLGFQIQALENVNKELKEKNRGLLDIAYDSPILEESG